MTTLGTGVPPLPLSAEGAGGVASKSAASDPRALAPEWRCFHCDEILTTKEAALEHFGPHCMSVPACQIDIDKDREMEEYHDRCLAEDSDSESQFHAMLSDHERALIRE